MDLILARLKKSRYSVMASGQKKSSHPRPTHFFCWWYFRGDSYKLLQIIFDEHEIWDRQTYNLPFIWVASWKGEAKKSRKIIILIQINYNELYRVSSETTMIHAVSNSQHFREVFFHLFYFPMFQWLPRNLFRL